MYFIEKTINYICIIYLDITLFDARIENIFYSLQSSMERCSDDDIDDGAL